MVLVMGTKAVVQARRRRSRLKRRMLVKSEQLWWCPRDESEGGTIQMTVLAPLVGAREVLDVTETGGGKTGRGMTARGRRRRRRSSSSSKSSGGSDEDFYGKESRKFASLLQKAQKHPGKLLRSGLEEMNRYLVARSGEDNQAGGAAGGGAEEIPEGDFCRAPGGGSVCGKRKRWRRERKTKRKKQRLQRQERQAEGKRKRQGKAETAERRGRSRQGSWACWRQKLRAYDNRPLHVLGHTRQLVKGLASVQTGMGASLRKALYSPTGRGGRVPGSSIFPLPMPQSCRDALQRVLDSTDKKRDRAGKTWSDCHEAWCGLTILGLNNALSFTTDVGPAVNPAQEKVCELLSKDCCDFVRGDGLGKDGSRSRAPEVPWSQKIGDLSVNYTGDIVEKARWLTWEQVQPGLPPEGRGGSLEAVSFCDSWG